MKKLLPLLALGLSGCLRFGAEPPEALLALSPAQTAPAGQTLTGTEDTSIAVGVPSAAQELQTQRIPVRATDTTIAYVKDAQWVENPNRLFTRLLMETIAARTGRLVVGPRGQRGSPNRIDGDLTMFGVDAATGTAVVTFDASYARGPDAPLQKRRFEARVPVSPIEARPVGAALNTAANQVAAEVADWVGR